MLKVIHRWLRTGKLHGSPRQTQAMDPFIHEMTQSGVLASRANPGKARALNAYACRGQLERVLPGVYSKIGAAKTVEGRLRAVRAYGEDLVLTRRIAAQLTWWPELDVGDQWVLACPRPIDPGHELAFEQRLILPQLLTRHEGTLVTIPELTVLDLIPELDSAAVFEALRRRAITLERLERALALTPRRRGNRRRREILAETVDSPWSFLESTAHRYLREAGITGWTGNYRVELPSGAYWIDAAFPEEKVALEFDGWEFHSSRTAFEYDRSRDVDLARAGWLPVRFTNETVATIPVAVPEILARRRLR